MTTHRILHLASLRYLLVGALCGVVLSATWFARAHGNLLSFTETNASLCAEVYFHIGLAQRSNGSFHGRTESGGALRLGIVVKMKPL